MARLNWLGIVKRHLRSSIATDSQFSCLHQSLISTQGPSRFRYIHGTGPLFSPAQDYYQVLGIPPTATREEIKKAFHALAKKYHPDANKNNPSSKRVFQEIREAYETLGNSKKREEYDRSLSRSSEREQYDPRESEGFERAYRTHFSDSFHKIFSEIFEEGARHIATDIQVDVVLSFSEASKGCTKHLSFSSFVPCDFCDGRGYPLDATMAVCQTCRGLGRVTIPPFTSTCSTCKGMGRVIKEYCKSCRGSAVIEGTKEVRVTIPAGVECGDTIRVPGAGNAGGRGSQPGNLYIKLKVADDPIFSRDGADVYIDAYISFTQAILGGKIEVPTLSGKTWVKIPNGVQPGQLVILRGKGLPKHGFLVEHGDQYVRFCINFPTEINKRQHDILEEFAKEEFDNESRTDADGTWWNSWGRALERLGTSPKFMLQLSVFLLVLLLLNK